MSEFNNHTYMLDLRDVASVDGLHLRLREVFRFPAYYGRNWDAFWDCIGELARVPMRIEIVGFAGVVSRLGAPADTFLAVLHDFVDSRPGEVEIVLEEKNASLSGTDEESAAYNHIIKEGENHDD